MTEWRRKLSIIKALESLNQKGKDLFGDLSVSGLRDALSVKVNHITAEAILTYCQYYEDYKKNLHTELSGDLFLEDKIAEFPTLVYKEKVFKSSFLKSLAYKLKLRSIYLKVQKVSLVSNSLINYLWETFDFKGLAASEINANELDIAPDVLYSSGKKLIVRNIEKAYKKKKVVKGVSFYMTEGEVIGLLGPNGAGKTTSFYMVVGLVLADSGGIFLNNLEITQMPMYQRSKLGIGYLAQEASVFRKLSVEDNILAILEIQDITKDEKYQRLEELLTELDILHIRKSYGFQLSGGERRRTEIARALASNPAFLLLDEPFAGVDPIAVQEIQRIIIKLKDKGIGILITDHNARETLRITDRSYILADGIIRYSGKAKELANNEEVKKVYLGDEFSL